MAHYRCFPFDGDDAQYIKYLESQVVYYRYWYYQAPRQALPHAGPSQFDDPSPDQPNGGNVSSTQSTQKEGLKIISFKYNPKPSVPQWQNQLHGFLKSVPHFSKWEEWRKTNSFHTIKQNNIVIAALLEDSSPSVALDRLVTQSSISTINIASPEWIERSHRYAHQTAALEKLGTITSKIASFRQIVVASICVVMLHLKVSTDVVNRIMRACVSDVSDDESLRRYRRGAIWVNGCICRLSATWGHRSTEIFFLSGYELSYFARISESDCSLPYFIEQKQSKGVPPKEGSAWTPISIPCIIKRTAGRGVSLRDICDALEQTYELVNDIYERFYKTEEERYAHDPMLYGGGGCDPIFDPIF
ncbi:hypothetical protein AJ80_09937 [Polytolypa hystricis UAMH7299]|uniref:Uncharacterized protein n=1 Tax=Polytolypa hystricis (strain UAMH7299) TaxID=1447883 RepID=A0A2B7WG72_POLH7|nr:hypothetical protein AJ80_09937 [Polytolypa hystricis UAMH7299]